MQIKNISKIRHKHAVQKLARSVVHHAVVYPVSFLHQLVRGESTNAELRRL